MNFLVAHRSVSQARAKPEAPRQAAKPRPAKRCAQRERPASERSERPDARPRDQRVERPKRYPARRTVTMYLGC